MVKRIAYVGFLSASVAVLSACAADTTAAPTVTNECSGPERTILVAPELADWLPPLRWAHDQWTAVAPTSAPRFEVSAAAARLARTCVTSIVPAPELVFPVFAVTERGYILVQRDTFAGDEEGRRALMLHELGHLLYGLGDRRGDMSSAMGLPIHVPARLSPTDANAARRSASN